MAARTPERQPGQAAHGSSLINVFERSAEQAGKDLTAVGESPSTRIIADVLDNSERLGRALRDQCWALLRIDLGALDTANPDQAAVVLDTVTKVHEEINRTLHDFRTWTGQASECTRRLDQQRQGLESRVQELDERMRQVQQQLEELAHRIEEARRPNIGDLFGVGALRRLISELSGENEAERRFAEALQQQMNHGARLEHYLMAQVAALHLATRSAGALFDAAQRIALGADAMVSQLREALEVRKDEQAFRLKSTAAAGIAKQAEQYAREVAGSPR